MPRKKAISPGERVHLHGDRRCREHVRAVVSLVVVIVVLVVEDIKIPLFYRVREGPLETVNLFRGEGGCALSDHRFFGGRLGFTRLRRTPERAHPDRCRSESQLSQKRSSKCRGHRSPRERRTCSPRRKCALTGRAKKIGRARHRERVRWASSLPAWCWSAFNTGREKLLWMTPDPRAGRIGGS